MCQFIPMKNFYPKRNNRHNTTLRQFIYSLVAESLQVAFYQNSRIVNEVNQKLLLHECAPEVLSLVRKVFNTVLINSRNGDIHISTERYRDMIILNIEERNNNNGYALAYSIGSLATDATMAVAGASLAIDGAQKRTTVVSLFFPYAQKNSPAFERGSDLTNHLFC